MDPDPDPVSQDLADITDLDPKHCVGLKLYSKLIDVLSKLNEILLISIILTKINLHPLKIRLELSFQLSFLKISYY